MNTIILPLDNHIIRELRAGDEILLSGSMIVGRDAASKKIIQIIQSGSLLPVDFTNQTIFYLGPSPAPPGRVIGSAGPTTASRMDKLTEPLLNQGLRGMIGKGKRSNEIINLIKKYQAVYFTTYGGLAAYLAQKITKYEVIAFPELLAESLAKIEVNNFPVTVAIDSFGNNIFNK